MRREFLSTPPNCGSVSIVPVGFSSEMSNAIRRQNGTAGVEYRATVNLGSRSPRRGSLPNIFFPHLEMNGNTPSDTFKRLARGKSNGTDGKLTVSSPVYPQTRENASRSGGSKHPYIKAKDVLLTDLSSLNMGDPRSPQQVTQLSHFYELCNAKVRYMDYLDDVVEYKSDSGVRKGNAFPVGIPMERMHTFAIRRPVVRMNAQMRTSSMPVVPVMTQAFRPTDNRYVHNTAKLQSRRQECNMANGDLTSKKQALKQSFAMNGQGKSLKSAAGDLAVRGKVFSGQNDKNRKLVPSDMALYRRTTRPSSSMPVLVSKSSSERSKKRGVHFSVCNEIFEYTPSAPVGQHN